MTWLLVNLESDGVPMVTTWDTRAEAEAMMEKQNRGGGPNTITLLCEVHWRIGPA